MRIAVLKSGQTYVGWSDFLTCEEWSEHCDWMFDHAKGESMQFVVTSRAKRLGGTATGSCFEHGPGFIFPYETPESLNEKVKKLYPQLI